MTGPSSLLVHSPTDPFSEVQSAVLCQRLGVLKRRVDFGCEYRMVNFDPGVLAKAKLITKIDVHEEIKTMASAMLVRFEALCRTLVDLRPDQIHVELSENIELKNAVVALESIWVEAQYVLQQDCLDFVRELLNYLPRMSHKFRWQLRVALADQDREQEPQQRQESQASIRESSHTVLYETLPILLYMEGIWHDLFVDTISFQFGSLDCSNAEQDGIKQELLQQFQSHGISQRIVSQLDISFGQVDATLDVSGSKVSIKQIREKIAGNSIAIQGSRGRVVETMPSHYFSGLFCVADDRNLLVRRDFAKFDEHKIAKLRRFLLGESHPDEVNDDVQLQYLQDLHKKLKS
eukprot:CAMPEP_0117459574 /NCGR_PEP_ID=MMETSP0784-20121206/1552_1 /TAXON_ID=39447 /ORGANISM="" /LENGTH=347 /DNA_ID=CAMNT_0005253199 /DNA_START=44 /DNA_END=1084 /DNA_ORIENTATION=-